MKSTAILTICCAVLLAALGWSSSISVERVDNLKTQLATMEASAARWRATAEALQGKNYTHSTLAAACLQREAEAQSDAVLRESILHMGPPAPIPPAEKDKGVSRETRRAAAEYLNRDL